MMGSLPPVDDRQLLVVNHFLPGNEQKFIERLREIASRRNGVTNEQIPALMSIAVETVQEMVVGPRYVAILFKDGRIARIPLTPTMRTLPQPSPNPPPSNRPSPPNTSGGQPGGGNPAPVPIGGSGASSAAGQAPAMTRTAKFRRVMLATSSRRGDRSVIVDRARPMLPASAVPEDLIAQAQVVLQGKSREVIVRELQRTNLNVNEAVNNLLSRDDDDDDGSEGGSEVCLPEELLTLLDHGSSLLESEALYGGDSFDYLLSSRERAARKEKEKEKSGKPKSEAPAGEGLRRFEMEPRSELQWWEGDGPPSDRKFSKIACTNAELLALDQDGDLWGWRWSQPKGDEVHHSMLAAVGFPDKREACDRVTELVASSLRIAVMTADNRFATWVCHIAVGERGANALLTTLRAFPGHNFEKEPFEQLVCSNQMAVVRCSPNVFYWCGMYPLADRKKLFEKARARSRKHVSFDTNQIVEGCEVRTKSGPIYHLGCVALNLNRATPMIGVLQESAWSLSEVCRFRIIEPLTYDEECVLPHDLEKHQSRTLRDDSRAAVIAKLALDEDVFTAPKEAVREEPWPISDVIFLHEECGADTAVVRIVDGGYCAVEFKVENMELSYIYATPYSLALARSADATKPKMRLMRKDELAVVTDSRSFLVPSCIKREPSRFVMPNSSGGAKRIISAVADSMGVRMLVERRGMVWMVRLSVRGKLLSSHLLPLHGPALFRPLRDPTAIEGGTGVGRERGGQPTLLNYGDDSVLVLKDGYGGLIPLVRDAVAGYREPTFLQLAAAPAALGVFNVGKDETGIPAKALREAVVVQLVGSDSRSLDRRTPSLLYAVLCCDEKSVTDILNHLAEEQDEELARREIVEAHADGGRNILHTAVSNAFATKNCFEGDVERKYPMGEDDLPPPSLMSSQAAVEHARAIDQKWQRILRSSMRSSASASNVEVAVQANDPSVVHAMDTAPAEVQVQTIKDEEMDEQQAEDASRPRLVANVTPTARPKNRQTASINIINLLTTHAISMPYLNMLLLERDVNGLTPFMAAVNERAYSAARYLFKAVVNLFVDQNNDKMGSVLRPYLFPTGCRPDDSPLFVVCYNDTCSFTWTGEEHINQDIFECRTCGLVGSLCCCTECAYTCHRNHDCKLKRTSPTAYCDCWEKACCRSLVNGNQSAREKVLKDLLDRSELYRETNGNGEHLALFLARKLARQSSEQANYNKKSRRMDRLAQSELKSMGGSGLRDRGEREGVPEHDLEPPKFAKTALLDCLRNWDVVKSIAMVGVRSMHEHETMVEELFHLHSQHGSVHLDRFMLLLLSKCHDQVPQLTDALIDVLSKNVNEARRTGKNLQEASFILSRFVRSVARLYIVACVISPAAAAAAITGNTGVSPSKETVGGEKGYRTISLTGLFSLVRKDSTPSKDSKQRAMATFVVRCRAFLDHFHVYALHELSQLADALLAPVRMGMVRPTKLVNQVYGANADNIENLEKFLNNDFDLTSIMARATESSSSEQSKPRRKRDRVVSRRETDRGDEAEASTPVTAAATADAARPDTRESSAESDAFSDSDSEGDVPSSRRLTSQSSTAAAPASTEEPAVNDAENRPRRRVVGIGRHHLYEFSSEDGEDSEQSRDEDDDDDVEMEEDDTGDGMYSEDDGDVTMQSVPDGAAGYVVNETDDAEGDGDEDGDEGAEGDEDRELESYSPASPVYSDGQNNYSDDEGNDDAFAASGRRKNARDETRNDEISVELLDADEDPVRNEEMPRLGPDDGNARDAPVSGDGVVQAPPQQEVAVNDRPSEGQHDVDDEDKPISAAIAAEVSASVTIPTTSASVAANVASTNAPETAVQATAPASGEQSTAGEGGEDRRRERDRQAQRDAYMNRASRGRLGQIPARAAPFGLSSGSVSGGLGSGIPASLAAQADARVERMVADRLAHRRNATTSPWSMPRGPTDGAAWRRTPLDVGESRETGLTVAYPAGTIPSTDNSTGGAATSAATPTTVPPPPPPGLAPQESRRGAATEQPPAAPEDTAPTALKASVQLATGFWFAVRFCTELLENVHEWSECGTKEATKLDEPTQAVIDKCREMVKSRLNDSWNWLMVVLDQAEAQIKYGNSVMAHYGHEYRPQDDAVQQKEVKKREKSRRSPHGREEKACLLPCCTGVDPGQNRRSPLDILFASMRAHSAEDGDTFPPIDIDNLKPSALVVDAFISFSSSVEKAEKSEHRRFVEAMEATEMATSEDVRKEGMKSLRKFYQRSNSVSYPGVSFSDAHDTLAIPCASMLPLVERPHLLTPNAELETIFGAPVQHRTKEQHEEVIRAHGQPHSANHSLAAAALSAHNVFDNRNPMALTASAPGNLFAASTDAATPSSSSAGDQPKVEESTEKVKGKRKTPPASEKRPSRKGRRGGKKEEEEKMEIEVISPPSLPPAIAAPEGFTPFTLEEVRKAFQEFREDRMQRYLGRWRYTLQLMARDLHADLLAAFGGESIGSSLLRELSGFHMKQAEFRRHMDKFRSGLTKDVSIEVHRDPSQLVRETVFQLNKTYLRRIAQSGPRTSVSSQEKSPPLAAHKVRVKFFDEPGEGTGVARSFYTALAEALHSMKQLPFTDFGWNAPNDDFLFGGPAALMSAPSSADRNAPSAGAAAAGGGGGSNNSGSATRRIQLIRGRDAIFATTTRRRGGSRRHQLNFLLPPYTPVDVAAAEALPDNHDAIMEAEMVYESQRVGGGVGSGIAAGLQAIFVGDDPPPPPPPSASSSQASMQQQMMRLPQAFLDRLFVKVRALQPAAAARITGMFADLPISSAVLMLTDPSILRGYVSDAVDQMVNGGATSDLALLKANDDTDKREDGDSNKDENSSSEPDDAPLFFRPSKRAHFSPVPGRLSPIRISAFRNIGRVMGLCISQCEMFPLRISRHVLKYILDRPLNWHDFAFYDPTLFESMRRLILECTKDGGDQLLDSLDIYYEVDVPADVAGKPNHKVDLVPGGSKIRVTQATLIEYVYRFAEQRLLGQNTKCLAAIRQGVLDVVPPSRLRDLTAEDLRLILCGTETVSISLMQTYTSWSDESHAAPDTIARFKNWFWQVAERFSNQDKQDLIFFWTGSPSLPASEEGFQPMPTVVIRPVDEGFLPTANTCISRLYVPLYPSKKILTAKLTLAIKARNFGFV